MRKLFVIWTGVNLAINRVEADFNSSGSALDNIQWNGPSPLSESPVSVPSTSVKPEFDDKVYSDEEVVDLSQVKSKSDSSWNGCENPKSVGFCYDNYSAGVPDASALEQCMSDHDCCPGDSPTGYADCLSSASSHLSEYAAFAIAAWGACAFSAGGGCVARHKRAAYWKQVMWAAAVGFAVAGTCSLIMLDMGDSDSIAAHPAALGATLGLSIVASCFTYFACKKPRQADGGRELVANFAPANLADDEAADDNDLERSDSSASHLLASTSV